MRTPLLLSFVALGLTACSQREELWDLPVNGQNVTVHGMRSSAAIVDVAGDRVIFAAPKSVDELAFSSTPLGHGYATSQPTSDGARLVVLGSGDVPRKSEEDEGPALAVIDSLKDPPAVTRYELSDPLSGLVVDPTSEYAVIYPGAGDFSFVQNPNELVLVRLNEPPSATNPVPASLRSFGGRPEGFTFTPELELPGTNARLLVVRTDRDVALIDLDAPEKPEITVKLTAGAVAPRPVGIAVSDGEPGDANDARLAVRLEADPNVILLDMLPTPADKADTSPHSFTPVPNIVDVGGVPSDVIFGKTDGGLRLLALVPSKQALTLVEPATGVTTDVALGGAFQRMSIVTDVVGPTAEGSDVALLWSTSSPAIAFVALGSTIGKPYKSVEVRTLEQPVASVIDVPAPNAHLKILGAPGGSSFVILNLLSRTTTPLLVSSYDAQAVVSPDGERLWIHSASNQAVAQVSLKDLHPRNLLLNQYVSRAFDLARPDGGRALLTLDTSGSLAFTLLDANNPSLESSTEYLGVLLGDYQVEEAQ